jgi:hypothetical protein
MATWKRLKRATEKGEEIDVNMDTVVHMQRHTDHTLMHFAGAQSVNVWETPDQIHLTRPMRQAFE